MANSKRPKKNNSEWVEVSPDDSNWVEVPIGSESDRRAINQKVIQIGAAPTPSEPPPGILTGIKQTFQLPRDPSIEDPILKPLVSALNLGGTASIGAAEGGVPGLAQIGARELPDVDRSSLAYNIPYYASALGSAPARGLSAALSKAGSYMPKILRPLATGAGSGAAEGLVGEIGNEQEGGPPYGERVAGQAITGGAYGYPGAVLGRGATLALGSLGRGMMRFPIKGKANEGFAGQEKDVVEDMLQEGVWGTPGGIRRGGEAVSDKFGPQVGQALSEATQAGATVDRTKIMNSLVGEYQRYAKGLTESDKAAADELWGVISRANQLLPANPTPVQVMDFVKNQRSIMRDQGGYDALTKAFQAALNPKISTEGVGRKAAIAAGGKGYGEATEAALPPKKAKKFREAQERYAAGERIAAVGSEAEKAAAGGARSPDAQFSGRVGAGWAALRTAPALPLTGLGSLLARSDLPQPSRAYQDSSMWNKLLTATPQSRTDAQRALIQDAIRQGYNPWEIASFVDQLTGGGSK